MTTDSAFFLKEWFDEIMNDEYTNTTPEEMAYILWGATQYCYTGKPVDLGEIFGKENKGLNRTLSGYYRQIDKILQNKNNQGKKNQKYNDDDVEKLAAAGKSQTEICAELGYDVSKAKSLSSNPGYKKGRQLFLERKGQESKECDSCDSNSKNNPELSKTVENKQEQAKCGFQF